MQSCRTMEAVLVPFLRIPQIESIYIVDNIVQSFLWTFANSINSLGLIEQRLCLQSSRKIPCNEKTLVIYRYPNSKKKNKKISIGNFVILYKVNIILLKKNQKTYLKGRSVCEREKNYVEILNYTQTVKSVMHIEN